MLTPQEGQQLRDKADAIGNSIAAGESAAQISKTIEEFKSAVVTMTELEASPIQEEERVPEHESELETVQ